MTTAAKESAKEKEQAAEAPRRTRDGKLSKPRLMIHDGKFESVVPAVTGEELDNDESSPTFGVVRTVELEKAYKVRGVLPKGAKYGRRVIGEVHEIIDAAEAEALEAKGFREASATELKRYETGAGRRTVNVDEIAAAERERAQNNMRRFGGDSRGRRGEEE